MDGTLYPETDEIKEFKKDLLCKYISRKKKIPLEKVREICERDYEKTDSFTFVLEDCEIKDPKAVLENLIIKDLIIPLIKFDSRINVFLNQIKNKYKIFLITHTYKKHAVPRLEKAGVDYKVFDTCIFGDQGLFKTNRKVFDKVLGELDLKPSEVLYVGDREKVDIIVPKQMGMLTAIVNSRSRLADYHLKSVYDLGKLLTL